MANSTYQSKIIGISELMELCAIDGEQHRPRIEAWAASAESEIKNFTNFDFDTTTIPEDKLKIFVSVATIYLQERVREYFLAPSYESRAIEGLKIRLGLIAKDLLGQ